MKENRFNRDWQIFVFAAIQPVIFSIKYPFYFMYVAELALLFGFLLAQLFAKRKVNFLYLNLASMFTIIGFQLAANVIDFNHQFENSLMTNFLLLFFFFTNPLFTTVC